MPKTEKKMKVKVRDQEPAKDPKGGRKHGHHHSNVSTPVDPVVPADSLGGGPLPFGHQPQ